MATYTDVYHVSWQAVQASAISKGLTVVGLDGAKTGEELASKKQ
jgi:hypothetical protein